MPYTCALKAPMPSLGSRNWALLVTATLVAIGGSLLLHADSLHSGFRGDDYVQGAMLRRSFPAPRNALDLFNFSSGQADEQQRLLDFGYLPWWTTPNIRLRMWRPLASALLATDHLVFGWHATPMHAHSLLWLALLICAAALLLRGTVSPLLASLSVLLFALQPAHTVPVAWLANRSTLVATALGFLSVAAYTRYRSRGSARYAWSATAFCVAALLSGEYALTALAYAFAYECTATRGGLASRARALWPVALPVSAYLIAHSWLGADVVGSGFYVSPVQAPAQFAVAALTRVPVLAADLLLGVPSAYFTFGAPLRNFVLSLEVFSPRVWQALPDWPTIHVVLGYATLLAYGLGVRRLMGACHGHERRTLAFFALGSVLALLPTAGSLPGDRLLVAAALGTSVVVVSALLHLAARDMHAMPKSHALVRSVAALTLFGLFFGYGTLRTARQADFFAAESESLRVWALDADAPQHETDNARVYVIGSADFTTSANLPWLRLVHGLPLSRSYRRLSPAVAAMDIRRVAERSIDLVVLTGHASSSAVPSLYRDTRHPLHAGDYFSMPGFSARVLRVVEGNPSVVRFSFDRSVDDDSLWFLHSTYTGLRRVRMPEPGQTLRLPRPVLMNLRASGLAPAGDFSE